MATTDLVKRLEELLEPLAEANGYELVAIEQAGARRSPVIRVLLDHEGGVDLDAIFAANQWISDALDEADPIPGAYTLEVSSPGVDRPLRKLADFERFAGETVTLKARSADSPRGVWTGRLVGVDGDDVVVDVDGEQVRVAYADIIKARIKGVVNFDSERGTQ